MANEEKIPVFGPHSRNTGGWGLGKMGSKGAKDIAAGGPGRKKRGQVHNIGNPQFGGGKNPPSGGKGKP